MQDKLIDSKKKKQRGGAGAKFLMVAVILFLFGHAAYNYIPTAYDGENFKQRMNEIVMNAYAMPNAPTSTPEGVADRLRKFFPDNNIPADAYLKVEKVGNGMVKAQVYFKKSVNILPFGIYRYNYEFNHTATPTGFLTK